MSLPVDEDAGALGQILANMPGFVLMVDQDMVIRYINRVEPGYDRSQVLGMPAQAFLVSGSEQVWEATVSSVFDTGEAADFEVEMPTPDGSLAWYSSHVIPYREGDRVTGAVIMAENITELKAAQAAVARLRQLLPICSWCNRIQDGEGTWDTTERYLARKLDTHITHGMCPDCFARTEEELDPDETGTAV